MPINAGYEYFNAEKEYLDAKTLEEKIYWLEAMIKAAPKHKSSEHFVSELKQRLKKFQEKSEKLSKKKGGIRGIKKEGFQFILVGKSNSGKSTLLSRLTNAQPQIAEYQFTTKRPELGTFDHEGIKAQIVDLPSIGSEYFDIGLINTADCLIIVITQLEELPEIENMLQRARGKRLIAINKSDLLNSEELRKLEAKIKTKKIRGFIISALSEIGLEELKQAMIKETGMIRVYMKEPGKPVKDKPMVLKAGATVKDVAEGIRKGFYLTVKETRVTGPSSKFPNQKIGLTHVMKDRDIVEFHTR
jgi:small GTP-binding protein